MSGQPARDRVQTGVRLEKRLVKVLKALAELQDLSLGDLLEAMAVHCLSGRQAFNAECLAKAGELAGIYGCSLNPAGPPAVSQGEG